VKLTRLFAGAFVAATMVGGAAQAASISYDADVALTTTNWTATRQLQQFDPSLGTLTGVSFTLSADIAGTASYESLDASPSIINITLSVNVSVMGPTPGSIIALAVAPVINQAFAVTAFDGVLDFDGTSGGVFTSPASLISTTTNVAPIDFGAFIGLGLLDFDLQAIGNSFATGAGNLITQFSTQALGKIEITYTYGDVTIPEPMSLALFGLGLAGLGVAMRRKA
jgi:hypothetical protein